MLQYSSGSPALKSWPYMKRWSFKVFANKLSFGCSNSLLGWIRYFPLIKLPDFRNSFHFEFVVGKKEIQIYFTGKRYFIQISLSSYYNPIFLTWSNNLRRPRLIYCFDLAPLIFFFEQHIRPYFQIVFDRN